MGATLLSLARRLLAVAALTAAPLAAAAQAPVEEPPQAPVARVELRSDVSLERPGELLDLVAVRPGEPLLDADVRRTLRNLHATGLAAEVELWTETEPAGTVVMVALWGNVLVEEVRLEGELGVSRDVLWREVAQRQGQPLVEDRVLRSVYQLQDRLQARGYREAVVRVAVDEDPARRRAVVVFQVTGGPRATIREVTMTGDLGPFTAAQLLEPLRAGPGEAYRREEVQEDQERLLAWLHERGHRRAEVRVVGETYDPAAGGMDLRYLVEAGPRIEVEVVGASLEQLERRGLLPFLGDEGYDEVLVLQAIERIRRHFQERGHHAVVVEREEAMAGDDVLRLTLRVVPGPVATLREVRFAGNEEIPDERLAELMTTSPRRVLVAGSGRLVDEVLAQDLDNIRSWYGLQGFTRASVGPAIIDEEGADLVLTIPIVEGPRQRVVELRLEGVEALDGEALRRSLPLTEGGPFHPRRLDEALDRVRSAYDERGYTQSRVSATTEWDAERTLASVVIRVTEGPQQVAGNLILRGTQRTRPEVVHAFARLEPGEPVSGRRLLELQRDLYRLGVFSRVSVTLAPAADEARVRDVVVRVEEGRNRRVAYGVGYDSEEGLGGLFSYSHANLAGRAAHLQLDLRASQRTERFRLLVRQPTWGGRWPGAVNALLYQEREDRPSFDIDRRGTQVEVTRGDERLRFSVFGDFRLVDLVLAEDVLLEDLPDDRDLLDVRILSVTPRVTLDRRDDPLDPTRGYLASALLEYAFPAGDLAEEHFLKGFLQLVGYWDLGGGGVLATSARAGAIEPLEEGRGVAISERFFAGGRTTHRAYDRDRLGILGETLDANRNAIGGNGLLLFNVDYRFPIAGPLGGTVFVDAGNVWRQWDEARVEELRLGAGVGLRYLSPIGPLRLEVGWKLDREPEEPLSKVFLSFGNAF